MALWRSEKDDMPYLWSGHRAYNKWNLTDAVMTISKMQSCLYTFLDFWWKLTEEYNITRWSVHGGSAMSAFCHHSSNPWDDDIDITLASCDALFEMYDNGRNVTEVHPNIDVKTYYNSVFKGRLLPNSDEWILLQGSDPTQKRTNIYFKLKHINLTDIRTFYGDSTFVEVLFGEGDGNEMGGIDIMCFHDTLAESYVTDSEQGPMNSSGYESFCKSISLALTVGKLLFLTACSLILP